MKASVGQRVLMILWKSIRKLLCVFSSGQEQHQSYDLLELQYVLPEHIADDSVRSALNDHIEVYSWLAHRVSIIRSKEEMPSGCIGVLNFLRGGKLEYRLNLRIQVEYVAKTTIFSEKIGL